LLLLPEMVMIARRTQDEIWVIHRVTSDAKSGDPKLAPRGRAPLSSSWRSGDSSVLCCREGAGLISHNLFQETGILQPYFLDSRHHRKKEFYAELSHLVRSKWVQFVRSHGGRIEPKDSNKRLGDHASVPQVHGLFPPMLEDAKLSPPRNQKRT